MLVALLLIPIAASDDVAAFKLPPPDLKISCISTSCGARPREKSYRVPGGSAPLAKTSKDRAFAADGSKCQVVGDKRCPARARTIFSTDFSD